MKAKHEWPYNKKDIFDSFHENLTISNIICLKFAFYHSAYQRFFYFFHESLTIR